MIDEFIPRVAVVTLAVIVVGVIGACLYGLFDKGVDDATIFSFIGPAFTMIVGAFVGLIAGRKSAPGSGG